MTELLKRKIGIVRDGGSDYPIFQKIVEVILEANHGCPTDLIFVDLSRQSLRDPIDAYWQATKNSSEYSLPSDPAKALRNKIAGLLLTGIYPDFTAEVGSISNADVILLTSDSEHQVNSVNDYLEEEYVFALLNILHSAIYKFYDSQVKYGYSYQNLPLVIPIITFPSTEVVIAAARDLYRQCLGKEPTDLKRLLYGKTEIPAITDDEWEKNAYQYLTEEGIEKIYKTIPDCRQMIHLLSVLNPLQISCP
jgi:hypothetical protein